ncbi:MAG: aspartate/glutamate racemase family protein [Promethearchaeota archaeon]|nr:MAG: aspartate/glutamate racemase family protein [Candidatus Lokiarchaeota archaeon]
MKLLGLIGGLSWESTIEYYRIINELVKEKLGGWNSAKLLLYSVNFEEIYTLQQQNKWNEIAEIFIEISKNLEEAGCSAILICSNTAHKIANKIMPRIEIPIIHVVDETAKAIKNSKINTVGLLGTKFTMEGDFYVQILEEKYGLQVIVPDQEQREYINNAIFNEFAQGIFLTSTKTKFLDIIDSLNKKGMQGIILGCTEIPLLIHQEDVEVPLFDTLNIHLRAAVKFILE